MKAQKTYYVYITVSKRNGTLYIGVTSNLKKRIYEHKESLIDGFTKKYNVDKLVYFETTNDVNSAIQREKQTKKWKREWKIKLIEKENPCWIDLYYNLEQ
ncbi:MAG: GIY-YIG nuclease family protein [Candidatus Pacebacteria bacterium]|nr:GIY-YIG nuclease family protein [Candidatus Paceibacterota bacterium]